MRPTVLCVNLPADKLSRVCFACMRLSLLVKCVEQKDLLQPLGALCGLISAQADVSAPDTPFTGEMLIMVNLNRQQAERLLTALKQAKVHIPLKAVLTPTNMHWDCIRLHAELTAERTAIETGAPDPHTAD